jgi:hypothetical protein
VVFYTLYNEHLLYNTVPVQALAGVGLPV